MKIYEYIPGQKIKIGGTVVALGFFDGVHAAHRKLLKTARKTAEEKGLVFAVFTFRSESESLKDGQRLYSTEDKLSIFEKLGVQAVFLSDFSSVAQISAEDFVKECLISDMCCKVAVAGYDYRFGHKASGDITLLNSILTENGSVCITEQAHLIDGEKISTTKIKELLRAGLPDKAAVFLGSPYFIRTDVKHGIGLGKKLGFPTVNSEFDNQTPPLKVGVYRTAVEIQGKLYTGITNVGTCPTFGERKLHAETYIVDFSGNLYGSVIRVFFLGYLREEKTYNSAEELILQIKVDKNRAIKENGDLKWQEIGLR